jgi:predicted DNA binding CopG/RHH family protein
MRDKRAKFVELANARVNRAIKDIKLVGNLSNKSSYEYTEEDARKILRTLQREIDALKARFSETGGGGETTFNL